MRAVLIGVVAASGLALALTSSTATAQDRDCADFDNQAEAQEFYGSRGGPDSDPHRLDADNDGVACEDLPCPCSDDDMGPPFPSPPPGSRRTIERVTNGAVTAELSYTTRRNRFGGKDFRDIRMKITRASSVLRDEPVGRPCRAGCFPARSYDRPGPSVRVRDLDADGEPEVLVDLWTGGARCCTFSLIYGYRGFSYERDRNSWGVGYRLVDRDRDRALEFEGRDERLNYAFTCGACGEEPLRIWRYSLGNIDVVTRAFPGALRGHARLLFRKYRRVRGRGPDFAKGYLTPYVAEQCLLGRCRAGLRAVERAVRRGELEQRREFNFPPFGREYKVKLMRLLRRTGYLR